MDFFQVLHRILTPIALDLDVRITFLLLSKSNFTEMGFLFLYNY